MDTYKMYEIFMNIFSENMYPQSSKILRISGYYVKYFVNSWLICYCMKDLWKFKCDDVFFYRLLKIKFAFA